MELAELYGAALVEVHKRHKKVELLFERNSKVSKLRFEGLLFETEVSPMDQRVIKVMISKSLGMKALDLLRYYNYHDKHEFKQIFIEFEGSSFKKNEIYCVCRKYSFKYDVNDVG